MRTIRISRSRTLARSLAVPLAAGGWRLGYRSGLARVLMNDDQVVIRPVGVVGILAFRRELALDRRAIERVNAIGRDDLPDLKVRLLGTGMPGLQAGLFANGHGCCFVLLGRADRFLRIDTGSGTIRCTVIQVRDPDLLAATLGGSADLRMSQRTHVMPWPAGP